MIDIWFKESFGTPISWNCFGLMGHVKTQIVFGCDISWIFWIWPITWPKMQINFFFDSKYTQVGISIPHLLSFLTKRLNNGESCKGQKRMSSSGHNKKKAQWQKRKMSVHCKSCEQMETSLLFSRPLFSICSHELWYSQRFFTASSSITSAAAVVVSKVEP